MEPSTRRYHFSVAMDHMQIMLYDAMADIVMGKRLLEHRASINACLDLTSQLMASTESDDVKRRFYQSLSLVLQSLSVLINEQIQKSR